MIELCSHIKCPFSDEQTGCTKYKTAYKECHLVNYLKMFGYPGFADEGYGYEVVTPDNIKGTLSVDRFLYVKDLLPFSNESDYHTVKEIEKENIAIINRQNNIVKLNKNEVIPKVGRGQTSTPK